MFQRAPMSCWYAMGQAVVRAVQGAAVKLAWSLADGVWNTARVPGQCVTLSVDGSILHATTCVGSTQQEAVLADGVRGLSACAARRHCGRAPRPFPWAASSLT